MKNSTRRIISMILAVCIWMSVLPTLVVPVEAAPTVYSQLDSRWKDHQYGYSNSAGTKKATIGSGGCGILSLVNAVYYLSGKFIDPVSLADWSVNNGYRVNGVGTSHGLFPAYSNAYGNTYGFSCTSSTGTTSWETLKDHLLSGGVSIASIKTVSTGSDHLLVIADYNSSDGTYLVLDSYASSNRGTSSGYAWMNKTQFLNRMTAKKFILISPNGHTHSYSGSYHDAAHPHKVYQKCSCGATQYTGATTTVSSCATCNPVNTTSKYNAVLPFKAYLKGTADIVPYSDKQMTSPKGEIWTTDECTITAVYTNGACEVKYLAGTETKTAYTPLSNFVGNTSASLAQQTVNHEVKTYIRSSTSSTQYGHTDPGDVIYKLGTSGSMTQIFYPTGSGYKLAWVVTGELPERKYDDRFNPYCSIKGYPCATANFEVYQSDHTTYLGKIYTTDYCTINAVYADGWCQVTYPTSSGDKTGYVTLDKFVYNVNASHVKYTANAQIKVHKNSSLPGDLNWYISSGDQFFVVGSSGSSSQVLYPIDAQYGGGYKLGWISTSNIPKTTYTVSYNANGGSGAPGNQTKTHGVTLTLSSTKPTRSGYTFVGWATSASATSASYMPGASYTNDANLTLYAVWKLNKYEISYNANGGSGAPAAQSKTHGTNLTLSSTVPKKYYTVTFNANGGSVDVANRQVACTFKGWATSSTATSAAYQPGGTFTANANTTLYAVWQNASLGSYPIPVRSGYVFDGWYTAASGGSQVTSSTAISGNMTIYAHWTIATYEVNYDANGGTGAPASQTKTHGQNLTLSSVVPTRTGYFFCGWGTEEAPDSVQYQPGGTYTVNSDIMLVAVWQQVALTKIEVATKPSKTAYYVGDTLNESGLTLKATYNDGTTKTITSGFSCSPTTLNTAGTQTITVSYGGKTATFTVTVSAVQITGLTVTTKPTKTSYYVGDTLDTAGLKLTATYNNGTTKTITSGFSCTPTTLNTAGTQTITVSYGEKTATFTVTVSTVQITNLTVTTKPTKTSYYVGDTLDTAGLKLTATYNNGTTKTITSGFSCSPTTLNTAGTQTITVSYGGKTATFTVTVKVYPRAQLRVGTAAANPGDTVQIPIRLEASTGLVAARLKISYDSNTMALVAVSDGGILGEHVFGADLASNPYIVVWENGLAASNYTGTGTLVTLTFRVKDNAPEGSYPVSVTYDSEEVYNKDLENVELSVVNGSVQVEAPEVVPDAPEIVLSDSVQQMYAGNYRYDESVVITLRADQAASYWLQIRAGSADGAILVNESLENGSYTFTPAGTGIYYVMARAYNAVGESEKATCTFRVRSTLGDTWLSAEPYGAEQTVFDVGDRVYFNFRIFDPDTNELLYTFSDQSTATELAILNPNGSVVAEASFTNDDEDQIIFIPAESGSYTARVIFNGKTYYSQFTVNDVSREVANGWSGSTTWVLTDDGVLTFSGNGKMKNYTYKSEMPWYKYFDMITRIVIEEGVTSIGDYAFYGVPKVESIEIASTVTSIGDYAFKNAPKLNNVVLPQKLTSLGESAFYACTGLTSIEIPARLYTIKAYTFKNCSNLTSVIFNEGNLQKISDGAFYGTGLTELVLPDCLDILDVYAFKNCTRLASIELGTGLTELREAVFYGTAIPTIEIPEGITKIGPYAFKNCVKLVTIDLPETLNSVGEASFYACTALESLDLPDSVTKIGNYAFRKCASLLDVHFGAGLTNIGESSFYGCESIVFLTIPGKVTTIQGYAFKGCTDLEIVEMPASLKTLGDSAFHTCTSLSEIVIPGSVTKIGEYCFSGSTGIDHITFEGDAPAIGSGAFNKISATAYYPSGNATWTSSVRQNYGGSITWLAQ